MNAYALYRKPPSIIPTFICALLVAAAIYSDHFYATIVFIVLGALALNLYLQEWWKR